jgi:hypothetical protein
MNFAVGQGLSDAERDDVKLLIFRYFLRRGDCYCTPLTWPRDLSAALSSRLAKQFAQGERAGQMRFDLPLRVHAERRAQSGFR